MAKNVQSNVGFEDCLQGKPEEAVKQKDLRIGIAVARFNSAITHLMLEGAQTRLAELGVKESQITIATVPGAFELPLVAQKMADSGCDAVIALGCVIRGETAHFDYVCSEAARGITLTSLDTETPIIFGVLTTENLEQALERAHPEKDNKGGEAAEAALEMINLLEQLQHQERLLSV